MSLLRLLTLALLFSTLSCTAQRPLSVPDTYAADIDAWRQNRMNNLLAPTGWLSLVGLHWLEAGANTFGSDANEDLVFPPGAPKHIGTYYLDGQTVRAETDDLPGLTISEDGYSEMGYGSLQWFVIERGGQYGIRIRDTLLPARIRLRAIPHFPTDAS
ncbi:MAG: hypothetical protein KDC54_23135, partial [Lewinella sp.]|nr:hypothetical protein [Lewinella sp.]